ncbi:1525_t:CDS:2 [Funneliformis geosporum]|uniref:1525_t:CDS:1 n=1 Tax=Funneliformis geosporum TaxID=1117311 RepID=A0A9W4WPP0_9GLOM|nr:1525_t:CDS:2 [Funneliformis geosporum]
MLSIQRERIIGAYLSGIRQKVISAQLNISSSTFAPLGNITDKLNSRLNTTLHYNIVRKYLHDEGFSSYATCKKPLLTEKQQKNRFKWFGPLVVVERNMNSDDYVNVLANYFIP